MLWFVGLELITCKRCDYKNGFVSMAGVEAVNIQQESDEE